MNISYRRGIQKNFMIIDPQELDWDGYECRMILRNNIDGLLKMKIRPMEDGVRFYYDITSRQPLSRMLNGARWNAEDFRSFMRGIFDTLTRMESYLLRESRILLDPDLIYMEPGSRELSFCYVPGLERPFPEDLGDLLEKLLECVDHTDKECVVLSYGLYQETRKENYGMDDLLRLIYSVPAGDKAQEETEETELITPVLPDREAADEEGQKSGFWEKLKDRVFSHLPKEEDEAEDDGGLWFDGPDEPEQTQPVLSEEPVRDPAADDTLTLTDLRSKLEMHVLRATDPGLGDIPLAYYPFIIGKQENMVDHMLDDDTVSRLHLKIEKKDERYLIEDLNSTNGTRLNGELLENNEKREITAGDEIDIARFRFRFE